MIIQNITVVDIIGKEKCKCHLKQKNLIDFNFTRLTFKKETEIFQIQF